MTDGPPRRIMIDLARHQREQAVNAEAAIWAAVRGRRLGVKFRRQVPIGRYIVDFLCLEKRLVVEIDGPSHDNPEQAAKDVARDAWLKSEGFRVLRLSNDLVIGATELAVQQIVKALG